MVQIAHHDDQSAVLNAYAIFIANVLSHTERIVVLYMVDNDKDGLYIQFFFKALQRYVHAVYGPLREYAIRVRHVLAGVLKIGYGNVFCVPVGSLLCIAAQCGSSTLLIRQRGATANQSRHEATKENPYPDVAPFCPFGIAFFVGRCYFVTLLPIFALQSFVALGVLAFQFIR